MTITGGERAGTSLAGPDEIEFGIEGQRTHRSAHVAYFWETEKEFATAVRSLIEGANPAACKLFGRTDEEIRQVSRAGLVGSRDRRLPAFLEESMRTGRVRGDPTLSRLSGKTVQPFSARFRVPFTKIHRARVRRA